MRTGLEYGLGLAHLSYVTQDTRKTPKMETIVHLIEAARYNGLAMTKAKDFPNKQRYLKTLLIENEIYNAQNRIGFTKNNFLPAPMDKTAQDRLFAMSAVQYNANLEEVESILKTSIYVDEAFEIYLEERIKGDKEEPQNAIQ
jgi:hypothetical protein